MKKQTNNAASAIEAFRLRLTCSIKSSELLAQFSFLRILGTRSSADCRHRSQKPGGLRRALNWRSFWSAVAGLRGDTALGSGARDTFDSPKNLLAYGNATARGEAEFKDDQLPIRQALARLTPHHNPILTQSNLNTFLRMRKGATYHTGRFLSVNNTSQPRHISLPSIHVRLTLRVGSRTQCHIQKSKC